MESFVTLQLEDDEIRFTPDGRIAVVDAINALSGSDCPDCLWEELKRNHPQIGRMCSNYTFPEKGSALVADVESWVVIQDLLLEQLVEEDE
jgi:hypothetical protein